jgi:tRNA-specific 2-thiouridylase
MALHRGVDRSKDQAYFLYGLPPKLLRRLHLPLGCMTKTEVRERARSLGLETADKPESQEICFVPTGDYRDLLRKRLPERHQALEPGPLVTMDGEVVGEHPGYAGFTVGQRKGLGSGSAEPRFVIDIRPETREVVIGPREAMFSNEVEVEAPRWLGPAPSTDMEVLVQLRHRARDVPARVEHRDEERIVLELTTPQPAVTPGQSAVVFHGNRVLGGGIIRHARRTSPLTSPP